MSRKWLAVAVKATISVLLIWYLLDRVDTAKVFTRALQLDVGDAILCLTLFALSICLTSIRWRLVAMLIDVTLDFSVCLRILFIGLFFNQTLPSSVGGDAVRVWLVTREGITLGKAVNSVLCDRVLGLVALLIVIGISLPIMQQHIDDAATRAVLSGLVAASGVALALFVLLGERLALLLRRWRYTRPFGNLATDFRRLFLRSGPFIVLISLSIVLHLMTVAATTLLAWGINIQVSFIDCLMVIPTVMLVLTLPISIAGWGVREGAMIAGFGFVGVTPGDALALSILLGLAQIAIALPGGVLWLINRPRSVRPRDLAPRAGG